MREHVTWRFRGTPDEVVHKIRGAGTDVGCRYRVWCIVNPPAEPFYYGVPTPRIGAYVIEALSQWQLLDDSIRENVFGLQQRFLDSTNLPEWVEWEDEDGDDFESIRILTGGPWVQGDAKA